MKIGFTGTMSCGKTTLVKELAKLPEFKDYKFATERSKYLRDLGIPLNEDSTIKGQAVFLAERATELMNENIITDRTIIDVMAFTSGSTIPYYEADDFNELASHLIKEYDHIFYISPKGIDIENNGVRTIDEEYRNRIDHTIKSLIDKYHSRIKHITYISGSIEERVQTIKETLSL